MRKKTYTAKEKSKSASILGHFGGVASAKKRKAKAQKKPAKKISNKCRTTAKKVAKKSTKKRRSSAKTNKQLSLF